MSSSPIGLENEALGGTYTRSIIFDSCQQEWYAACSIIENTLGVVKKDHPQITQVSPRSDEAGCYRSNFLLPAVTDAGKRVGLTVTRYDLSELQYGKRCVR